MAKTVILDTGPLVAFFNRRDSYHLWVEQQLASNDWAFKTCESVLAETLFLTQNSPKVVQALMQMMDVGVLTVLPAFGEYYPDIGNMLIKYADIPSSLADTSLVHLYNLNPGSAIFTIDSDFLTYRDSRGKPLSIIAPFL